MIGTILEGRYVIIKALGRGGFGETFLAEDLGAFKRRCVVKRFAFHIPDPELLQSFKERFELEAKTLMELGEKNDQIPRLHGYNSDGYLIQEFIAGQTLEKKVSNEGPLPEKLVKQILVSLLSVLEFVHSRKKIHRDINPKNIILREEDGKPVLIDFGAVKELMTLSSDAQSKLRSGTINIGTEGYTAQEQYDGEPDYCSDLYSLGATALFLLTGKNPKFLRASRRGDGGWRRSVPGVSESFASIIDKATQPRAYNRYSTAIEMKDDLLNSRIAHPDDDDDVSTKHLKRGEPVVDMATGQQLITVKPPVTFQLPPEYLYLAEGKQRGEHILYRKRDGQVLLYIPKDSQTDKPFLIDRHLVTNAQFALFLNDPETQKKIRQTQLNDVIVSTTSSGSLLLADALGFWNRNRNEPLGRTMGLTYTSQRWVPIDGAEHLPVVLVTVTGATWYAAWLKKLSLEEAQIGVGLPCESQWIRAALFEEKTGSLRRFPWGNSWDRQKLNSLCYWAGRDVTEGDAFYKAKASLTPVDAFPDGSSPCGLMDAFGNAWEWLNDSDNSGKFMIKGGAYTSPKTVFETATMYRQSDFVGQAIGFRCCWYV